MKLITSTVLLKELVSKALKGASFNKLLPLTSLMSIKCENGKLELCTTDGSNYLYIRHPFENEPFKAVVPADIFGKLVSKLTCDNTTLESADGVFTVTGNGKYSIELPLDENGAEIDYPNPLNNYIEAVVNSEHTIKSSDIERIISVAKPALAVTMETPCYTGYYCDDKRVIATDSFMICGLDCKLFESPKLVSAPMMELVNLITTDTIKVHSDSDVLVMYSDDCIVYGHTMEGIEDYAVNEISQLLETSLPKKCTVSKSKLLEILDRLVLFVDAYDNNGIWLTFGKDGLQITSKKSSGVETVDYIKAPETDEEFAGLIDVIMLQSQIKAYDGDAIEIEYGESQAIKFLSTNSTQLVALLEE